eukprot:m.214204 g.214204  ORF g.214204 m.214204 type:complete len:460 (-) comp19071_c0_seq4:1807-3186(-)
MIGIAEYLPVVFCVILPVIRGSNSWTLVQHTDCVGSGTVPGKWHPADASSVAKCQEKASDSNVSIFSFNAESKHCYLREDGVWDTQENPRTMCGCLPARVNGCPSSPSPSPPPGPPEPKYDGVVRASTDGTMEAYMIPPNKSNHASTIEVLPDGTLAAAWFSGEEEEANRCAIVFASLPAGSAQWTQAATLSVRDGYSNQNPVLFFDNSTGLLHLFHSQAPAKSGESESQIWHLQSADSGKTWTTPAPFFTAPGSFPRNRIIRRMDNTILFPYYNQAVGHPNWSVMGVSATASIAANTSWTAKVVPDSGSLVQPSVIRNPKNESQLVCFFRDRRAEHIYRATSADEGIQWSTPVATTLPNNNAGIESNTLLSGNIIIAFNPQTTSRDPLAVALSSDGGETWTTQRDVQHGTSASVQVAKGNEFSYPTILQTRDGVIHMMYTYNRDTIKYKAFNESWVSK